MNLTGHMVRNDLRRLRLPLTLWAALLVAKIGLGAVLRSGGAGSASWFERVAGTVYLLGALEVLMGYVLVAWLVHGDKPTGTTAFWMTRPMSGTRLLAAKLLGLAVIFAVAPLGVTLPWWLVCGYGPRELMLAAGETLFLHGVVVAFALPLAALTDEFSRYLMWTLVLVVALFAASLTMVVVPSIGGTGASANARLIETRGCLALALFLIGGGVAAVQQFRARQLLRSFATLGSGIVLALATLNYWPVDLSPKSAAPVDRPGRHAAGIRFALQSARTFEPPGRDAELTVSLKLEGMPPELFLYGGAADQQWRWAGGAWIERGGWVYGTWWKWPALHVLGVAPQKPNAEYETYLAEQRRSRGLAPMPVTEPGVQTTRVKLPPSIAARMRQEPPAYRLRAHFSLHRPEVVDERAPRVGERLARDPEHARLARVERSDDRLTVAMVERRSLLFWEFGRLDAVAAFLWGGRQLEPQYFLVNRGRGNATVGHRFEWRAARVGTVGIMWRKMSFAAPRDYLGDGKWVAQAGWFDGVTLAKVAFREEERFSTELRLERFDVVKSATKEGAP